MVRRAIVNEYIFWGLAALAVFTLSYAGSLCAILTGQKMDNRRNLKNLRALQARMGGALSLGAVLAGMQRGPQQPEPPYDFFKDGGNGHGHTG
jgi:hypothetical protein